ncbi:SCO5918 family protein [Amycolatopsis sp. NPDC005961]|uniref:SCO5918 family protein n=1 Tax=Amycolatopsis sp. NPDC005961 TaxID=3156720 RepID=UPI0033DFE5F6
MVRVIVGGRPLDLDREAVLTAMRDVEPETIREHLVEIGSTVFPPKQVLAVVTGWERTSFTTMEAQRVLTKVGFVCRRAGQATDGRASWLLDADTESPLDERVTALEAALTVAHQAIAGLSARVAELERKR